MNTKNVNKKHRWMRLVTSVSLATLVLSQMPLSSLFSTPALGQAAALYTDTSEEDNGGFLGFSGLDSKDVFGAVAVAVVVLGVRSAFGEANAAAASAGSGAPTGTPTTAATTNSLPDPAQSGDEKKTLWATLHDDSGKRFAQFSSVTELNEVAANPLEDQQNAPYTCFAPTDTALNSLPATELTKLTDKPGLSLNKTDNQKFLLKHVVLGKYNVRDLEQLETGFPLATVSGDTLTVTKNPDGTANVNGVPVLREDIRANNGVSHPVPAALK